MSRARVLRRIESDFAIVEEVENLAPSKPMSREELIEANRPYFKDLAKLIGKKKAKISFDSYIDGIMALREEGESADEGNPNLIRVSLKPRTGTLG